MKNAWLKFSQAFFFLQRAGELLNEVVEPVESDSGACYGDEDPSGSTDDGADDQRCSTDNHERDIASRAKSRFSSRGRGVRGRGAANSNGTAADGRASGCARVCRCRCRRRRLRLRNDGGGS